MSPRIRFGLGTAVWFLVSWNPLNVNAQIGSRVDFTSLHAKGVNVINMTLDKQGTIEYAGAAISRDGESFRPVENLFTSISYSESQSNVVAVIVGRFGMGKDYLEFETPGTYYLKVGVKYENVENPSVIYDHPVTISPILAADRSFLRRISDSRLLRNLWGRDLYENSPGDYRAWVHSEDGRDVRALTVIAELLEATRDDEPWVAARRQGPPETGTVWPDTLWSLAEEFPESSYAPYAAYYAGCGYLSCLAQTMKHEHGRLLLPEARECTYHGKAEAALTFAIERADVYLKPRATYMKAFLAICAAQWDDGETLLNDAQQQAPGEPTITEWVTQLRRSVARERGKDTSSHGQP